MEEVMDEKNSEEAEGRRIYLPHLRRANRHRLVDRRFWRKQSAKKISRKTNGKLPVDKNALKELDEQ
jgi:hypothetical protein